MAETSIEGRDESVGVESQRPGCASAGCTVEQGVATSGPKMGHGLLGVGTVARTGSRNLCCTLDCRLR